MYVINVDWELATNEADGVSYTRVKNKEKNEEGDRETAIYE